MFLNYLPKYDNKVIFQDAGLEEMPVRRRRMCKIKPEAHGGTCPQVGSGDRDF